jgi:uncharacterized protein DUF3987
MDNIILEETLDRVLSPACTTFRRIARVRKNGAGGNRAPEPEQPTCLRNWIEDCTAEALAMLLQQNPRGLLTLRNELSCWLSFGQYKSGGNGGATIL